MTLKITGVTLGWDGNPTLELDSQYVLPRDAERLIYGEYYPTGTLGEWPVDPVTGVKAPIGPTNCVREISGNRAIGVVALAFLAIVATIVLMWLCGCGTARATAPSWSDQRCQMLMNQRDAATWGAAFAGGLAGVGGLSTAFPDDEHKDVRLGLGISAAVVAATATSLTMLAKMKSGEFERYCGATDEPVLKLAPMPAEFEADGGTN
jgi:hypothetical protein